MGIQKFSLDDFSCDRKTMKEGGEACVVKGKHSKHGEVAVKTWLHVSDISIKEVELLMENVYHQNIIQILGILIDEDSRCIGYIMQYMPNGSLGDVIHNKSQHYDEHQIKSWILQICYGLSYLHDKKVIHRDIKPSNVLLGKSRDDVKLSDFGVAKSLENITSTLTRGLGTILYMAPEIFEGEKYDFSADIYSLSITIWEILHRRIPYNHNTAHLHLPYKISNGERPQLDNNLSEEASDLLTRCWDINASKRPTIDYVREFCSKATFSLIDLKHSVEECGNSFEQLNVHINNNNKESLGQIPLKKPNENFSIPNPIEGSSGGWIGNKPLDTLLMLENNGQKWKQLNLKLPDSIHGHGAQFLNNNLYIFGGWNEEEGVLNFTYKLSEDLRWEKMADMNQKRHRIANSSVILNNQIWVCGGSVRELDRLKSVEMYDPLENKWKYMKPTNKYRAGAAAAVVNGKIFCSGGWDHDELDSVECYDPSSDVWTIISNMPQDIMGHGAVEMDGNFIVMGGYNRIALLKNVWALDTADKSAAWIEKPSMSIPHCVFSIAKIHDKIFVCGGQTDEGETFDLVEIFDGEVWRYGPSMPTIRRNAPAVVIPIELARSLN